MNSYISSLRKSYSDNNTMAYIIFSDIIVFLSENYLKISYRLQFCMFKWRRLMSTNGAMIVSHSINYVSSYIQNLDTMLQEAKHPLPDFLVLIDFSMPFERQIKSYLSQYQLIKISFWDLELMHSKALYTTAGRQDILPGLKLLSLMWRREVINPLF